jgi:hypothetical protein
MRLHLPSSTLIATAAFALLTTSCKKELDAPPVRELPTGQVLTVAELRSLFTGSARRFGGDSSVFAVVTADEQNGNLYRNIFVQDHTGALQLRLRNPGGLYQGDSIRIYLPGTVLSSFSGMLQLDSVDVDNNVVKQATGIQKAPTTVTIAQITPAMQGMLIKLDSVEFADDQLGLTYANAVAQTTQNRTLRDCSGATVIVRSSGYASFAAQQLPQGRGNFTAVVGQFNNDMQLFIRNINEVRLNGPRCNGGGGEPCTYNVAPVASVAQDFSDVTVDNSDYANPSWLNINEQGSRFWRGRIFQSDKYARATGFAGNGVSVPPTESWLITPPVQVGGNPVLSFRAAQAFWTHTTDDPFKVFISVDYDGCEIADATWTEITGFNEPTSSNSNYQWVNSGAIDLTQFLPQGFTGTFHIGFRYFSVALQTTTIDIDDITITQ